ncbi:RrF2 family transcriptional regulator [Uliginosibacterium paludis]|uniref:Rrf2 family transcriptional regulator n=1 Tax=Uliginosibacterium paludis TaxID=1615952 RepID=A0ABV2CKT9_9RHOO
MKLNTFTDYALRVLMYVALHPERLATIQGIADAYGISASHLTKVVHHLAQTGALESVRGKGGGIRLGRPASEIRLGDVIRQAEGKTPIVECFGPDDACRITPRCKLAGVLKQAFNAMYAVLDGYTLADLIEQPAPLRSLFEIKAL